MKKNLDDDDDEEIEPETWNELCVRVGDGASSKDF